jgi:DNA ligase-associated metallophosphoesterase
MDGYGFSLAGARLTALGSGALWWGERRTLCVSDLHLGKSERHARRGGSALPPYEVQDTLNRLEAALQETEAETVICLGDSFDDDAAARALPGAEQDRIAGLMRHRRWIWIEGNHDPAPGPLGGEHAAELTLGPLTFRHIAQPADAAEVSGHYHPKARLRGTSRPAFLLDARRLILPAFGTYTGGLRSSDPALTALMAPEALAILTGPRPLPMPMPR